jgi:hypothetical protein
MSVWLALVMAGCLIAGFFAFNFPLLNRRSVEFGLVAALAWTAVKAAAMTGLVLATA